MEDMLRLLDDVQGELDGEYARFARRDFECKLEHHSRIQRVLARRDEMVEGSGLADSYWGRAFLAYDIGMEILPVDENGQFAAGWLRSLRVEYLEGYVYRVHMELGENAFVENECLTKEMYLDEREVETTAVRWRCSERHGVFAFFESENEDFEVFDILYELYVNSAFYFLQSE